MKKIPHIGVLAALAGVLVIAISMSGRGTEAGSGDVEWSFSTNPRSPVVGQQFSLTIYAMGGDGYPLGSSLDINPPEQQLVEGKAHPDVYHWTLTALQAGKVTVDSSIAFETWECPPGVTPTLPPGCPGYHYENSPEFSITIFQEPPDSDGDGCPDQSEDAATPGSEMQGGLRDYLNPSDYFNPTHDGQNRIDDVLMVVQAYFDDDTDGNPGLPPYAPGYNPATDRTDDPAYTEDWRLLGPNGQQRIDDVLAVIKQYYHDCS